MDLPNQSAQDALNLWNQHLSHMHFVAVMASLVLPEGDDNESSVFFSGTVFGDQFGTGVLAVTLYGSVPSFTGGSVMTISDTVFNIDYTWDSYRGPLQPVWIDFHRVALHEFGHALGLDHPDEHGQTKVAIMNSIISDVDSLQPDDIAGAKALYASGPGYKSSVSAPVLANISTRGFIGSGDDVLIGGFIVQGSEPATVIVRAIGSSLSARGIAGGINNPIITVQDSNHQEVATSSGWLTDEGAETIASYHLDPPNGDESALYLHLAPGAYTAIVHSTNPPTSTGIGLFELYDLHTTGGRAGNLSTRGQVLGGDNVLIGGVIIGGREAKPVIVRALGPSLADQGVQNALANPKLELHDASGSLLQSNDDWGQGPDAQTLSDDGLAPTRQKESALLTTLSPGSYTAIVSGVNGGSGIGLVEVYDTSPPPGI